jgi:hypothetical protein
MERERERERERDRMRQVGSSEMQTGNFFLFENLSFMREKDSVFFNQTFFFWKVINSNKKLSTSQSILRKDFPGPVL